MHNKYGRILLGVSIIIGVVLGALIPCEEVFACSDVGITYRSHVQDVGWMGWSNNGETSGTTGKSLRLEALQVKLTNPTEGMKLKSRVNVEDRGWSNWQEGSNILGTTGKSLRMEAVQFKLQGKGSEDYCVQYRVHVQDIGWMPWVLNGQVAGTTGKSLRIEAIEMKIVHKKDIEISDSNIKYSVYDVEKGNLGEVSGNDIAGNIEDNSNLEAISISTKSLPSNIKIKYQTHVQNLGWMPIVENGEVSGDIGSGNKIEAIKIWIEGSEIEYNIQYQVYLEDIGWQDWVENGKVAGTTDLDLSVKAIRIKISDEPLSISRNYEVVTTDKGYNEFLVGQAERNIASGVSGNLKVAQVADYINVKTLLHNSSISQFLRIDEFKDVDVNSINVYLDNSSYRGGVLNGKGQVFVDAAKKYNLDPLYLLAHSIHETGYGTSRLAQGISYKGVMTYNLFGIKAFDSNPNGQGAKFAYENQWTSIDAAIEGGAKWISDNYVNNSTYNQNTIFKMKWDTVYGWHQYATDAGWPSKVAAYIDKMSYMYDGSTLNYEITKLKDLQ